MIKKASLSSILVLLIFFMSFNIITTVDSAVEGNEYYDCTDLTAPDIFMYIGDFRTNGNIKGFFYDGETTLDSTLIPHAVQINDEYLNESYIETDSDVSYEGKKINYWFNCNDFFNTTIGVHNNVTLTMFNLNDFNSSYSLNQGSGAGGSGCFGFCDTVDCWGGPMPLDPGPLSHGDIVHSAVAVDNTAPIINISLADFMCCQNISWKCPYDPDQTNPYLVLWVPNNGSYIQDTLIIEALNQQFIRNRVIVSWNPAYENLDSTSWIETLFNIYPPPPTCPGDYIANTSFPLFLVFLPLILLPSILTFRKRKKK